MVHIICRMAWSYLSRRNRIRELESSWCWCYTLRRNRFPFSLSPCVCMFYHIHLSQRNTHTHAHTLFHDTGNVSYVLTSIRQLPLLSAWKELIRYIIVYVNRSNEILDISFSFLFLLLRFSCYVFHFTLHHSICSSSSFLILILILILIIIMLSFINFIYIFVFSLFFFSYFLSLLSVLPYFSAKKTILERVDGYMKRAEDLKNVLEGLNTNSKGGKFMQN